MADSLLMDAVVYLGAAVVCVPLASRFKLGSVLGYLGAGCLIGPWGLKLVHDPASTLHFAEFGVVLMLFLIGLELEPTRLWSMRRAVFGGGALQFAACGAALAAGLLGLGLPWKAALVGGLALGLSSTAVAVQTMHERNLAPTPMGRTAFGILLFQDLAAIPLLALVPMLAEGQAAGGPPAWRKALVALGAVAAVIVVGRLVTPRALRLVASTGLREVFTAFTLLLVIGIAQIMHLADVSMALGAFVAGVLLAGSEYRHALETDLEPFKGLLMGLFFIAVGMSINFGLLASRPGLVLGLVLGFQALKGLALRGIAGPLEVAAPQRWLFAAVLAQGGEFAFVVFGVARAARLLPGDWDALLTLAVALSMALTPLLLIVHDRAASAAMARQQRPDDAVDDHGAPVIIAGFGRMGQIVGRLLFASGIKATVLDHDPDQIESIRRFDFRVYYGDATRTDLLRAAGADRARLLINTIDDPATSLALVDAVREEFPRLTILSRARNLTHFFELRRRGVEVVERETFEASLRIGRLALERLGVGPYEARERADRFRRHNVQAIEELVTPLADEAQRISLVRAAREQLERQIQQDMAELDDHAGHAAWQEAHNHAKESPGEPS